MPNTLITSAGLDFVLSAHDDGVHVQVGYFLPVYDSRIDPLIQPQASAFSAVADPSSTEPYGEKLWRRQNAPYTLSDGEQFLISANGMTVNGDIVNGSFQNKAAQTNLYNGHPLVDQVSGTNLALSGVGKWVSDTAFVTVDGDNTAPAGTEGLYPVTDYYPVQESSAAGHLRGSFKCRFNDDVGRIKFNKIALYAIQVVNGTPTGSYGFFGEAYFAEPQVKTSLATDGLDEFVFDVQIDLHSMSASWDNVFFGSSADYWNRAPGGLYYPNRIGVGTFEDSTAEISATMHLKKTRDTSALPQLRMDYDNDNLIKWDVLWNGDIMLESLGYGSNYCGELTGTGGSLPDKTTLLTKWPRRLSLGTSANEFRSIRLNANNEEHTLISYGAGSIYNKIAEIKLGRTSDSQTEAIWLADLGIGVTSGADLYGAYRGGDLPRADSSVIVYTSFCGDTNADAKVMLVAGVSSTAPWPETDGQTGLTHKTLLAALDDFDNYCGHFKNDSESHMVARGGFHMRGALELSNPRDDFAGGNYVHNDALLYTRKGVLVIAAGYVGSLDSAQGVISAGSNFANQVGAGATLFLGGRKIVMSNNTEPWLNTYYDLGSVDKRFDRLYSKSVDASVSQTALDSIGGGSIGGSTSAVSHFGGFSVFEEVSKIAEGAMYGSTYLLPRGLIGYRHASGNLIADTTYLGSETHKIDGAHLQRLNVYGFADASVFRASTGVKSGFTESSDPSVKWKVVEYTTVGSGVENIELDTDQTKINVNTFLGATVALQPSTNNQWVLPGWEFQSSSFFYEVNFDFQYAAPIAYIASRSTLLDTAGHKVRIIVYYS